MSPAKRRSLRIEARHAVATLAALIALVPLAGCVVHARPAVAVRLGAPVVVAAGHVHTDRCGHFHHNGRWYHAAGHVHGPRCGHVHRGGIWILVR